MASFVINKQQFFVSACVCVCVRATRLVPVSWPLAGESSFGARWVGRIAFCVAAAVAAAAAAAAAAALADATRCCYSLLLIAVIFCCNICCCRCYSLLLSCAVFRCQVPPPARAARDDGQTDLQRGDPRRRLQQLHPRPCRVPAPRGQAPRRVRCYIDRFMNNCWFCRSDNIL